VRRERLNDSAAPHGMEVVFFKDARVLVTALGRLVRLLLLSVVDVGRLLLTDGYLGQETTDLLGGSCCSGPADTREFGRDGLLLFFCELNGSTELH